MAKSVYIHIPFCKQKCKYCSFISFPCIDRISKYVSSLLEEIDFYYKGEELNTLYFGGGTPSLLDMDSLRKIIEKFNLSEECEVTLELNPDDADLVYLEKLLEIGINRLSIGSQSFDDKILNLIGRRHNSAQIFEAVKLAKKSGFKNISLDLIYGLPTQTLESLNKDLVIINRLGIQHLSTYGLKIEEESFWGKCPPENLPDDDSQADMYLVINDFLEKNGYKRYEISNFAQEGFESKHNLNYWNNEEYYGLGVAAHGYIDGIRYSNSCILDEYITSPLVRKNEHVQSEQEILEEEIFLGFRREAGINVAFINKKFGIDFEDKYSNVLEKFVPQYIEKTPQGYKLTLDGILLSNNILSEFI